MGYATETKILEIRQNKMERTHKTKVYSTNEKDRKGERQREKMKDCRIKSKKMVAI